MNGKIANRLWKHTPRKLADNLDSECYANVASVIIGGSAVEIWNQVRATVKPIKDILEGELYDEHIKSTT